MRIGLGIGIVATLSIPAVIPIYDADAQRLFDRFATVPDLDRRKLYNDQFIAGRTKAFWSKTDALYTHAAHGQEAGRLNWLADKFNCLPVNSPVFTVDRGFFPDGSSSYLNTQFNPAIEIPLGSKYQQNSGTLAVRSNTNNQGAGSLAGFYDTKGTTINPRTASNSRMSARVNQLTAGETASAAVTTSIGLFLVTRLTAGTTITDFRMFKDGVYQPSAGVAPSASLTPANGEFRLGSISNSSFRACQFSGGLIGAGFTDQDVTDYDNWMDVWNAAVGVV